MGIEHEHVRDDEAQGHGPDDQDYQASPRYGRSGEQRMTDSTPALDRDAGQGQNGYGHRHTLQSKHAVNIQEYQIEFQLDGI